MTDEMLIVEWLTPEKPYSPVPRELIRESLEEQLSRRAIFQPSKTPVVRCKVSFSNELRNLPRLVAGSDILENLAPTKPHSPETLELEVASILNVIGSLNLQKCKPQNPRPTTHDSFIPQAAYLDALPHCNNMTNIFQAQIRCFTQARLLA
jgi:hypothetical protein